MAERLLLPVEDQARLLEQLRATVRRESQHHPVECVCTYCAAITLLALFEERSATVERLSRQLERANLKTKHRKEQIRLLTLQVQERKLQRPGLVALEKVVRRLQSELAECQYTCRKFATESAEQRARAQQAEAEVERLRKRIESIAHGEEPYPRSPAVPGWVRECLLSALEVTSSGWEE